MELDVPLTETYTAIKANLGFCVRRFQLLNDEKSNAILKLLIQKMQMA